MIPYNVLMPCRYGTMLCSRHDVYVGGSLERYGEFSQLEVEFLKPYLTPGATVLDLGANIGALTIPFATLVGPTGCVVAFEPQRICYQTLCANIQLNSLTNVVAIQQAVGTGTPDTIRIPLTDPHKRNNFGGIALSQEANGETVLHTALDEIGLPVASLVKVDVEGMEPEVLKGGRQYITDHNPVLYLEADRRDRKAELMGLLDELGYTAYQHNPPLYNPDNFRRDPVNQFGPIASINLLCLPRGQEPPTTMEKAA